MQARPQPVQQPEPPGIDHALLERYGRIPVPRYTSYPPANHWEGRFGEAEARQAFRGAGARAASIYVHVPFCRKLCFYCGCNMLVTRSESLVERYLQALELELDRVTALLPERPQIVQVHLGGGTPTYLDPDQLARLADAIQARLPWEPGIEASVEIHPAVTTRAQIRALARLGFNRVSMGVQDFDPAVQARINRRQSFEETRDLIIESRVRGFVSVNVDLMYGLPLQTVERFQRTLDLVESIRPDRIALFGYAHVPSMKKHQGVFQQEELPGPAERLALLESSIQRLLAAGYVHVGLDHFALEDDELCRARARGTLRRNFMGYTTCADSDVLAFGPSAISEVRGTFVQNARGVHEWAGRLEQGHLAAVRGHRPSNEDLARSALIMQLFCSLETDLDALRARFPGTLRELQAEDRDLTRLEGDGLIVRRGSRLRVTPLGQLLLRSVAAPFDTYHRVDARLHAPAL
ncbi:MAG TPA: oxygen-independent coproporphyrinogen III oxidase [Myxococcaceae bacterium]|nr:oxygen-independent coproporphyrinogen III oxidase [Myxococcaceae bacterium]